MKTLPPIVTATFAFLLALLAAASPARAQIAIESWVARSRPSGTSYARPNAITVDSAGDVAVTGAAVAAGNTDLYTAKYAGTNGALLWEKRYDAPATGPNDTDRAISVAMDSSGNVVVTGSTYGGSGSNSTDFYTAKYAAADGALLWEKHYNSPANGYDQGNSVALDGAGNVLVTGWSAPSDFYTAKYAAADGALLWEKYYNGPANGLDRTVSLAVDSAGNVAVTGHTWTGSNVDFYTAKYAAADGALLWEKLYNGPGNGNDMALAVAVDSAGNVAVTGQSQNGGNLDYYTAKYAAADGALLWEKRYNSPVTGSDDRAFAVTADSAGNVIVTGHSSGDYYTAKYAAADGALLWEKRYNGPANGGDYPYSVVVDSAGNVVVTGDSWNGSNYDYYTAKYAATDGHLLWEARYNGPANGLDRMDQNDPNASKVALTPDGGVVVTGYSSNGANTDFATVKYAPPIVTTHDLRTDWQNGAGNGSPGTFGPWSVREGGNVLPWQGSLPGFGGNLAYAPGNAGGDFLPCWFKVTDTLGADFQPGDIAMHSTDATNGGGNGIANVIWTSPAPGYADITGHIWYAHTGASRENTWRIYKNNTLLTTGVISETDPYDRASPFQFKAGTGGAGALQNIVVAAGDVLRLEVERTNSALGSLAGVELTVTHSTGLGVPPIVTTGAVTDITATEVTLRATANPGSLATQVRFYEEGSLLGSVNVPAGSSPVPVSLPLGGFTPGSSHTIHAYAINAAGNATANDVSFTLLGGPPTVTTDAVTDITPTSATLHATVNPNGVAATVHAGEWFYEQFISFASVEVPAGFTPVAVSLPMSGLTPGTTYAAFALVVSPYFSASGETVAFTTTITIADWKLTHLGDADAPDLDDPDGDGLFTLLEYGLSLAPGSPDAAPAVTPFVYAEGERLRLFIQRDPARTDVTIEVQAAGSVTGPWTTIAISALGAPFSGDGYVGGDGTALGVKTVEVRDTVNLADVPGRFLRVKVTR